MDLGLSPVLSVALRGDQVARRYLFVIVSTRTSPMAGPVPGRLRGVISGSRDVIPCCTPVI